MPASEIAPATSDALNAAREYGQLTLITHSCFQLFEFLSRAVHFDADKLRHFEHLRQRRADVLQMCEKALRAFVRFTAEDFVAVNTEAVEKVVFLLCSFLDEPRKDRLGCFNFPRMRFEVRMKTDEGRERLHSHSVLHSSKYVELIVIQVAAGKSSRRAMVQPR